MNVTRRQSLLALVVATGGIVARALPFARLRGMSKAMSASGTDPELGAYGPGSRKPSRRVEPASHSVKRHA
jgi:hypothetical protein